MLHVSKAFGVYRLERKKLVILAGVVLALCTFGLIVFESIASPTRTREFSNVGSIKAIGVGVYWDQACVNPVFSIKLEPI